MTRSTNDLIHKAIDLKNDVAKLKQELTEKNALIQELHQCIEKEAKLKAINFYMRGNKGLEGETQFDEASRKADLSWSNFLQGETHKVLSKIK